MKEAKPIDGEGQGTVMRYCSATTTVLVHMAELIENKPWIDIFHERVWSKVAARDRRMVNLTPEGTAVAHGLVATTLQDFARFAMLFTPSWQQVADEQVVPAKVLERIQTAGNSAGYKRCSTFHEHRELFGEDPDSNSFQFDDVLADGAMFEHGSLAQGICVDPGRDVVGVYFSTNGYVPPYGEDKMRGFIRRAAKLLAGEWPPRRLRTAPKRCQRWPGRIPTDGSALPYAGRGDPTSESSGSRPRSGCRSPPGYGGARPDIMLGWTRSSGGPHRPHLRGDRSSAGRPSCAPACSACSRTRGARSSRSCAQGPATARPPCWRRGSTAPVRSHRRG